MTHPSKIVSALSGALALTFSEYANGQLSAYQIGSTVRQAVRYPVDLDVWLVRPDSNSESIIPQLDHLLDCMADGTSRIGVVDASDETTRHCVHDVVARTQSKFPEVTITPQFGIGPLPQPPMTTPIVYIQVCGPLSIAENAYFFRKFPFHGRCFLDLNRNLTNSKKLRELVNIPDPDFYELVKWTSFLRLRAQSLANDLQRLACLKKILLNYCAYISPNGIYHRSDDLLVHYCTKWSYAEAIDHACSDILGRQLPGLI